MTALLPPKDSTLLPDSYGFLGLGKAADSNSDDYLIQRPFIGVPNPKGHLMFGGGRTSGTLNSMGEADDSIVDEGSVTYLQEALLNTLEIGVRSERPAKLKAEYSWSGIMGYSKDNVPWVGAVPDRSGVWLCGGYTGHGMPNATLCAKAVVQMVLAVEKGEDLLDVQQDMIRQAQIPPAYLITEERIAVAKGLPSVKEQDESDIMGYSNGQWVVQGTI